MEPTDDAVYVSAALAGDPDAFRMLVERHSRGLFGLAYHMTSNETDAEDVVQESFVRAYRQLSSFNGRSSFSTWIHRIAVNCSLDVLRSHRRRPSWQPAPEDDGDLLDRQPSPCPTPEGMAMAGEIRERLGAAMAQLTDVERAAFVLRHFEGLRCDEVGRVMGCGSTAARQSLFRAVRKLRRVLEPVAGVVK